MKNLSFSGLHSTKISSLHILPLITAFLLFLSLSFSGCHSDSEDNSNSFIPEEFNSMNDTAKVAWLMKNLPPDSVARFICMAALGDIEGVKIDTFVNVVTYAYINYPDSTVGDFGNAMDEFSHNLPLARKMKLYKLNDSDSVRSGYQLGLEFLVKIRDREMTMAQIDEEINGLKKACINDSMTYKRFVTGFRTALEVGKERDVPDSIYDRFHELN